MPLVKTMAISWIRGSYRTPLYVRTTPKPEQSCGSIMRDCGLPEQLRGFAEAPAIIRINLPKTIPSGGEPLPEEYVVDLAGEYVGNAPGIVETRNRALRVR